MAHHEITLNYIASPDPAGEAQFQPDTNPIVASQGDTIRFKLGAGPATGRIKVTFAAPARYSAATFNHGDPPVTVTQPITSATTYHCELLVNGSVVASSKENAGGDIVPPSEI